VNHADAGLLSDCRGGGSTTYASEKSGRNQAQEDSFRVRRSGYWIIRTILHVMETQVRVRKPGNSSDVVLQTSCPCS